MEKKLVQTTSHLDDLLSDLNNTDIFSYDTETNAKVDRFEVSMVGMSFSGPFDRAYYIPFLHQDEAEQLDIHWTLGELKPFFTDKDKQKICHNVKFDEMVLSRYGIRVEGFGHDTMTMAWLLKEQQARGSKGLKKLAETHLGVRMTTYEEVVDAKKRKRGEAKDFNFAKVALKDALSYAADDAYYCWKLFVKFKEELIQQKLWDAYRYVEGPFNRVLGDMEARGVTIDLDAVEYADKRLPKLLEEVEADIYKQAGEVFNIGSGPQLGPILFEKLGIGKNVPKTKTGNYATDKKTLEIYATKHKIVEDILRRKKIQKTHSTFVEGTKKFIAQDGRIHPRFNGTGTVTGRLSGSNPNLQQIEGDEVEEIKVRNFFVASPGHKLIVSDYSQVELRLMAHFSKDKYMIESFLSGRDFHDEVARRMFHIKDEDEVPRRLRVVAKTLNFGVGYGRGPKGIAEQLDISQTEAQDFIANWFEKFAGVSAYKKYLISQARRQGFIRTLTGRKRRLLPDIQSDDWRLRGRAERQAFNTKIQGSAADLIKMAMNNLHEPLEKYNAHMIIQIHDELVIECPDDDNRVYDCMTEVKSIMENPLNGKNPLRLPLVTEPVIADRWGEAK